LLLFMLLLGCCISTGAAKSIPKVHLWFTGSAGQGNLPTAAKWSHLVGSSLK
jgi:hypothetical protein